MLLRILLALTLAVGATVTTEEPPVPEPCPLVALENGEVKHACPEDGPPLGDPSATPTPEFSLP